MTEMQAMTTQASKLRKCNASDITASNTTTLLWGLASAFETAVDSNDDDEHLSTKKEVLWIAM